MDNKQFTDRDSGSAALYIYVVVYISRQTNYIWEKNNFPLLGDQLQHPYPHWLN